MYKDMYVEYTDHLHGWTNTEVLSWEAFCNLGMEPFIEITFCCATDDPRVNVD